MTEETPVPETVEEEPAADPVGAPEEPEEAPAADPEEED